MKECSQCKNLKELKYFYKKTNNLDDGFRSKCKDCCKNRQKKYRGINKDRLNAYSKIYYLNNKEKAREYQKKYRLLNSEPFTPMTDEEKKLAKREHDKKYNSKYPEKRKARNAVQLIKVGYGYHKHHWSYKEEDWNDFIIMKQKNHIKLHKYLRYNAKYFCYESLDGCLLDTKEKHELYIESLNIYYEKR